MKKEKRKIRKIDASGKPLGRIATQIALTLRGKDKPAFRPHKDGGDFVEVENIKEIKITGNKMKDKVYYKHSGYPGHLKSEKMKEVFEKDPGEVLKRAVWGMLPKNKLRKEMIKRLKIVKK